MALLKIILMEMNEAAPAFGNCQFRNLPSTNRMIRTSHGFIVV